MSDKPLGRARSTETKYARTPLWLFETGATLQAKATYAWLHGRYGHYDLVVPSYNTLAKELGVSKGSVINYVKEKYGHDNVAQIGTFGTLAGQGGIRGGSSRLTYSADASRTTTDGLYSFNNQYGNTVLSGALRTGPMSTS
jgi:hypothetical protein